jgi:hypothetical protein
MPRIHEPEPGTGSSHPAHERQDARRHEGDEPILRPPFESPPTTFVGRASDSAVAGVHASTDEQQGTGQPEDLSGIKPSGGRPWYDLTTTTSGILTLQEVMENHPDDTEWGDIPTGLHAIQGDSKTNRLTRSFVNGDQQVYRITMNYGLTVESTANHPWFAHHPNSWEDR